ncbi:GyrI-like domain-containing protein [Methanoregula sp.]|jgi:effector-binding domain-containing protein|uniref:GyrI-like domain-containing protein n=1 Tax=Methanoregula sp. TaxID=2052170 RepID=UPI0026399516|nr:GyrI-like domain-containing protein [Methanoregula sp.]MDD5142044.1 GyrI-like domain-containing protein [Methanoregula sp.]
MPEKGKITLIEVSPMDVLGTEKTGTYALIPELLMKVFSYMMEQKISIAGPPVFNCHECSPEAVQVANANGTARVEVAWPVTGPASGSGDIRRYTLPGGKMVHVIHKGPYDSCESTYLSAFAWIEQRGLTISGPIREIYPNDPREVPPEEILTEIYIPVA